MLQILLVLYWAICLLLSVFIIIYQISSKSRATTTTRKNFHVLATFVYMPGMIYDPTFLYLASGVMLAFFIAVEVPTILARVSIEIIFIFYFCNNCWWISDNQTFENLTFGRLFPSRIYSTCWWKGHLSFTNARISTMRFIISPLDAKQ